MHRIIFGTLLLALAPLTQAGIYKCTRADGTFVFQDNPCAAAEAGKAESKPVDKTASVAVQAAMKILGVAASIEQMQRWCAREDYPSAITISNARREWTSKHVALLDKAGQVMQNRLSHDERRKAMAQIRAVGEESVQKLATAPKEDRVLWCHTAAARIASPEMDLLAQPKLFDAVMSPR